MLHYQDSRFSSQHISDSPLSKRYHNVGKRSAGHGHEEAGSELTNPAEQLPASWDVTVSGRPTRKLNCSWGSWAGWPPVSTSSPGQRGALHSSEAPHRETKSAHWTEGLISPLLVSRSNQVSLAGQGTADSEGRLSTCCVLRQKLAGLFGKTETK